MKVGLGLQHLAQPLAHLPLQEPQDSADFLQRETLAPQLGNHCNFDYFLGLIEALVPLMARRNNFPLVPPLQLPQADLSNAGDITGGEGANAVLAFRTSFLCFEHIPPADVYK